MTLRVGDFRFDERGQMGVVVQPVGPNSPGRVERSGQRFDKARHLGARNGLNEAERQQFSQTMEQVRKIPDPKERMNFLASQIDQVKADPQQYNYLRYLQGEMAFIMNTYGLHPRVYEISDDQVT